MKKIKVNSRDWQRLRQAQANIQNRLCGICSVHLDSTMRGPQLDHDHDTQVVRGALCLSCNLKLGWMEKRKADISRYLSRNPSGQSHIVSNDAILDKLDQRATEQRAAFARSRQLRRVPTSYYTDE